MGFLGKLLKIVAVVAAVVAVGYLVAPVFTASIIDGIAAIGSELAGSVRDAFSVAGDTATSTAVSEAAAVGADKATAAAFSDGAAGLGLDTVSAVGGDVAAAAPAADVAATAIPETAAQAADATAPLNPGLPDAATATSNATPATSNAATVTGNAAVDVSVPESTRVATDAASKVATDPSLTVGDFARADRLASTNPSLTAGDFARADRLASTNPSLTAGDFARADRLSNPYQTVTALNPNAVQPGMLRSAFDATKGFVKENPLLAAMGFKAVGSYLGDDPTQRRIDLEDYLRSRASQSVIGSYSPVNTAAPQQPLQRPSGGNVFNRPGMLGRTGG